MNTITWLALFYLIPTGRPLPVCDRKHDADVAELDGVRWTCDATLGQWSKQKGGK